MNGGYQMSNELIKDDYDPNYDYDFKELIGKKVIRCDASPECIYFYLSDRTIHRYTANGDCCSHSWFENFYEINEANNFSVMGIKEIKLEIHGATKTPYSEEEMEYTNWVLKTDIGYLNIEMRNSSNGYYGGSVQHEELRYV